MFAHKIETVVHKEGVLIDWLRQQHKKDAGLASICIGSFLLAATGLLNGQAVAINRLFADEFRRLYPEVLLEDNRIIVDNGSLYTCGGAFSFTTLVIYFIEKFCCREVAIMASKILLIDMHQHLQAGIPGFRLQRTHSDDAVARVQQYLEKNYDRPITMAEMSGICHMSPRNISRRFEQATHNTPLEYLQRYRIENAKRMIEYRKDSIERIAMSCGYEDVKFFRTVFKRHVGMTPREYRHRYSR
jgi:transcriptional regulator GlxA family with amidase domain